jgi:predicted MFS family arabinose efflux permease
MQSTSTWFAFRNPVFLRIWVANVLSATFISAQDVTATWLMHDLGASFSLSLLATATSTPLLLFVLPAGIIADQTSRRTLLLGAIGWQAAFSALLAAGALTKMLSINLVLLCVFALGIGVAFGAPVWSAIVPGIVSKEELPSAVTLGGVQVNIAGIVGPALGGFLLPTLGAPLLISLNALTLLIVGLVILPWKPRQVPVQPPREDLVQSFVGSLRYAAKASRIRIILFRNFPFSLAIAAIPALLPVIVYTELKGSAALLGLAFTCVAAGSLVGAVVVLPFLRRRISPNAITLVAIGIMPVVLLAMAFARNQLTVLAYSAIAGVAWALAGSELWLAGQRAVSGRVRGRMNAFLIMAGQGGIALGSILLATGALHGGLSWTLVGAAGVALVGFGLGYRFSINFPKGPEPAPEPGAPEEETIGYFMDFLRRIAGYEEGDKRPNEANANGQNQDQEPKRAPVMPRRRC